MIVSAEVVPYELRFLDPMLAGNVILESRSGLLLGLTDENGVTGWGDAAPLPGWSPESIPTVEAALLGLAASLEARPRRASSLTATAVAWLPRLPSACAALVQALLDIAAQSAGVPIAGLLARGREPRMSVPVNALIAGDGPDAIHASASAAAEEGFGTFKLKIADGPASLDVDRVRAMRDAVGAAAKIRLDAGGRWDAETAIDTLRRLEPFDVEYVEDPVPELESLITVGSAVPVRIAVDALMAGSPDPTAVLAAAAADVYVLKPSALGGPGLTVQLAERIVQSGAEAVVTSFLESAIGVTGALHVAAAIPAGPASGLATSYFFEENVAIPPVISGGAIELPGEAGLGVAPAPQDL